MVELVEPVFQSLARRIPGEQEALMSVGQPQAPGGPVANAGGFASLATPQPQQGGFFSRLASNPLFAAGVSGLNGGNPLQGLQRAQALKAKQEQQALRNQLLIREEQRQQALFAQAQESRQILGGLIANLPDEADREAAMGIFATGEMGKLAEFFEKSTDPVTINNQVFDRRALAQAARLAGAGGVDKSQNKQILLENGLDERRVDVAERNASTSERSAGLAERKFSADEKARGATVVGDAIVDLSDPGNPRIKLQVKQPQTRKDVSNLENQLRDEHANASKDFVKVRDAFVRVESAAAEPSAAGDLALIFNFMKILDPGSTVREGEFATAQNAGGVDDRVFSLYNRVVSGERLTAEQRADFVGQARNLFAGQERLQTQTDSDFRSIAERNSVNPENVVRDLRPVQPLPDNADDLSQLSDQEVLKRLGIQ